MLSAFPSDLVASQKQAYGSPDPLYFLLEIFVFFLEECWHIC